MVDDGQGSDATKVWESKDRRGRAMRIDWGLGLTFLLELFQKYLHYWYPQFWREELCCFIFRDQLINLKIESLTWPIILLFYEHAI